MITNKLNKSAVTIFHPIVPTQNKLTLRCLSEQNTDIMKLKFQTKMVTERIHSPFYPLVQGIARIYLSFHLF